MFLQRFLCWTMLLGIAISAWFIQANAYINIDTGWFLEATQRMLAGGTYKNDFFENNPPWILYLTIPPVLFAKVFALNLALSMQIYVFSFAIISLGLCGYFFQKIFVKSDQYIAKFLLVVLAFLFFHAASTDFGQREHLFFMLSIPYLLLMEQRLQNCEVNVYLALWVGLLAGLVFLLKPYFLMMLFLIELYYLIRKKNLYAWIRPETLMIMGLLVIYAFIIVLYHRDYLEIVLPVAVRYGYFGTRNPWVIFFWGQLCIACYFLALFTILTFKVNRYKQLTILFLLAFVGYFFSYIVQQEHVYYRILPAYAMSLLLFMLAFACYVSNPLKRQYVWAVYLALMLFVYLKRTTYLFDFYPLFHPFFTLCFIIAMFAMVFYLRPASAKSTLILVFVGGMMLLLPLMQFLQMQKTLKEEKNNYESLVNYMNVHMRHQTYYFLATDIHHITEQDASYVSRFSFFWYLPGLIKQSYRPMDKQTYDQYYKDKQFFIDMIAEDLTVKKPQWVFLDVSTRKIYLFWRTPDTITPIPFDYLTYFNDNKTFIDIWKNYHYVTSVSGSKYKPLNPYQYQLQLSYQHVPEEKDIPFRSLYLYLNKQNQVEMAFKDDYKKLRRMVVFIDEKALRGIKYTLATQGRKLERQDKMIFFTWVLKQSAAYELYTYDIYRMTSLPANA